MRNYFTFSCRGGGSTNEDAYLVKEHPQDSSMLIVALADGQGGRPGGKAGAETACQAAVETAISYSVRQLTRPKTWSKIVEISDKAVYERPEAGLTTLVALCVTDRIVCGASNGDSAAILLNVRDQYHELTSSQFKNPPVGSGQAQAAPFREQLVDPWLILLMSDGLWKYAGWSSISSIIKTRQGTELMNALQNEIRLNIGPFRDDTTAVLVQSE
ncbi:MAG: protein phosphatase 2C domain-containing protein [Chloroflexota bacterium]